MTDAMTNKKLEKDWQMPQHTWKQAAIRLAIMFGGRFTDAIN